MVTSLTDITVSKFDDVYSYIKADPAIETELSDYFCFDAPNAKFSPMYRKKYWDGKIRLFNKRQSLLPTGLNRYIGVFAKEHGYKVEYAPELIMMNNFSLVEAKEFTKSLQIHSQGKPLDSREYQDVAFAKAIRYKRLMVVSPTASGKSYIIYNYVRYLLQMNPTVRGLLVVPTTSLVEQMAGDFKDYSSVNNWDVDLYVQKLYSGYDSTLLPSTQLLVSTWQSIYKYTTGFFENFGFVIGDEAHTFAAECVGGVMKKLTKAPYRLALTGTTDEQKVNNLTVEGFFGPMTKVITTKAMMDAGFSSQLAIKSIVLKHEEGTQRLVDIIKEEIKDQYKEAATAGYRAELTYIISHKGRNRFIRNLATSIEGNTLLLFHYVESHGQVLFDLIKDYIDASTRKCFFVHGGTETEDREAIRAIVEKENNAIIVASFGVFSTGINIRRLHNVIFASPTKSKKRTLQSIGRGLRLGEGKAQATLYDIADDFRLDTEDKPNYTLKHYATRMIMYMEEKFKVSHYDVPLKLDSSK